MKKVKEFYTSEDLANKLEVHIMTIYRYIKSGKLKAYKTGKEFRIAHEDYKAFLKRSAFIISG